MAEAIAAYSRPPQETIAFGKHFQRISPTKAFSKILKVVVASRLIMIYLTDKATPKSGKIG
jgi:hypothetical protein